MLMQMTHWLENVLEPISNTPHTDSGRLRLAAVLMPITWNTATNSFDMLLTKRAEHLKHHPGQIAFPGGKLDAIDQSLVQTALRESFEEIQLEAKQVSVIGAIEPVETTSGFNVTPFVGVVDNIGDLVANPDEVDEIMALPLVELMNRENHELTVVTIRPGVVTNVPVNVITVNDYCIWGATAYMLRCLFDRMDWALPVAQQ